MQTFKKLFAFMLIAFAVAPVLAMEPALLAMEDQIGDQVSRVKMSDESDFGLDGSNSDQESKRLLDSDIANQENKRPETPNTSNSEENSVNCSHISHGLWNQIKNSMRLDCQADANQVTTMDNSGYSSLLPTSVEDIARPEDKEDCVAHQADAAVADESVIAKPEDKEGHVAPQVNAPVLLLGDVNEAIESAVDHEVPTIASVEAEEELLNPANVRLPESDDEGSVEEKRAPDAASVESQDDEPINPADILLPESDDEDSVEEVQAPAPEAKAEQVEVPNVTVESEEDVDINSDDLFPQQATEKVAQKETIREKLVSICTLNYLAKDGKRDFRLENLRNNKAKLLATFGIFAGAATAIGSIVYGICNKLFAKSKAAAVDVNTTEVTEPQVKAVAETLVEEVKVEAPAAKPATSKVAKNGGPRHGRNACKKHHKPSVVRVKCTGKKKCNNNCK